MTAPTALHHQRDLGVAVVAAVVIHLLALLFCAILIYGGAFAQTPSEEEKPRSPLPPEDQGMTISWEDVPVEPESPEVLKDPEPTPEPPKSEPESEPKPPKQKFADVAENEAESPENAAFIGAGASQATSDAGAIAGDHPEVALSGSEQDFIKTRDTDFASDEKPNPAQRETLPELPEIEPKPEPELETPLETPPPPPEKQPTEPESVSDEAPMEEQFVDPEDPDQLIQEKPKSEKKPTKESKQKESTEPQKEPAPEKAPPLPPKPPKPPKKPTPPAQPTEPSPRGDEFRSQQRKTRVAGVLRASGTGSLDVANTPVGRYQAAIFKKLEIRWQEGSIRFRSHLAPGLITIRFLVDQEGRVSGQRRISMEGASQIQWGLILTAVGKTEIPPMPRRVREELGGEPLELIITFNY